jgi:hypothetical protein
LTIPPLFMCEVSQERRFRIISVASLVCVRLVGGESGKAEGCVVATPDFPALSVRNQGNGK